MFEILKSIFGNKKRMNLPAGKRNLFDGIVIRRNGWTRDAYTLWINKVTVHNITQGLKFNWL